MSTSMLVVFDCNVLLQAMLSRRGPAFACIEQVHSGVLTLVLSPYVLAEVRKLPDHRDLKRFKQLTPERVDEFLSGLLSRARVETTVPEVFTYPRDPDDAHYVNLALLVGASLIVSRDRDLLDLNDPTRQEGKEFMARFPALKILDPEALLAQLPAR